MNGRQGIRGRWRFLGRLPGARQTAGGPPILSRSGFTYMVVMFSVVLIGLSLTGAVQQWSTIMKREREAELLFRGDQIRRAIGRYYLSPRVQMHIAAEHQRYPKRLEDLVKVPDISETRRYLRKVYKDPVTQEDWVLVKIGDRIRGVRSKSDEEPLKKGNFPEEYKAFEEKARYSDWIFEFTPPPTQRPAGQLSFPASGVPGQSPASAVPGAPVPGQPLTPFQPPLIPRPSTILR